MIEANPVLQEDHCRGMILATYPLYYVAFDNTLAAGPVPTLFSEKPEESLAAALKRLRTLAIKVGTFAPENPVFAFKSKKNLTKVVLNKKLAELLGDFCDCNHKFPGHFFRAAIPSLLGSFPDQNSVSELKEWGNWGSDSYKHYMKDVRENRRKIFSKIIQLYVR